MSDSRFYHMSLAGELDRLATLEDALKARKNGGFIWLEYCSPDREQLAELIDPLGVHPLAIEDCIDENQIPKIEDYPNHSFILFNGFDYQGQGITIYEIDMFIGENVLITVSRTSTNGTPFLLDMERFVRQDIENSRLGPAYLAHSLLDHVVDRKFAAIESLEDELNSTEDVILAKTACWRCAKACSTSAKFWCASAGATAASFRPRRCSSTVTFMTTWQNSLS
jgi:magnesium transporter